MAAFNGLAGGLPVADLPAQVAAELAAWGTPADARMLAEVLAQEYPVLATDAQRLSTTQPDLIGEALIVRAFEGAPWLAAEAAPTVRRAYASGQGRAAEALFRVVQDFAFALEEQGATEEARNRGKAVLSWLTRLTQDTADPDSLLPLVFALPVDTLVLREAAADLTEALSKRWRIAAEAAGDPESDATSAALLNNLANRLSDLGRREAALAAAEEAVALYRALAAARPDAFTPALAMSLNNLANRLSDLGRREAALAAAEEAVALRRALAAARPDAFTPDLAMSLNNLANGLSALGRREAALAAAEEAVALYRALAAARPDAFTPDLATSLNNLANGLSALGRREAALAAAEEAVALYRALAAARPDAFTPDLATSLNTLANGLSALGRREAALAAAEEAVALRRALAAARPDAFTVDLARSLWVVGDLRSETGDPDGGIDALTEGVRRLAPVFAAYAEALAGMMAGLVQSYLKRCEEAGRNPDGAMLAPIFENFEHLERPRGS
jgi:tetratricopeptide (TPR) repeat protein